MAALLLAAACAHQPAEPKDVLYHPDYPRYRTAKELFTKASLVIEVE